MPMKAGPRAARRPTSRSPAWLARASASGSRRPSSSPASNRVRISVVVVGDLGDEGLARGASTPGSGRRRPRARHRARGPPGLRSSARSSPRCGPWTWSRRRSAAARVKPWRCISAATCAISSSDGVIRPDSPIMSAPFSFARRQDLVAGHHHAEVDDLEVVALQHDADDVLADVVDVALDGGEHDLALGPAAALRPSPPR